MRYIFHLDLDAFFASVEEAKNKKLKTKPIAISGHGMNSVVSTANYIARKCGVKAAMPVFKAKKLCPQLVIVPADYLSYEKYSHVFIKTLKEKFTNQIEISSIDECYMDVNKILPKYKNDPFVLAKAIQTEITKKLSITLSIGIGSNKFTAKMATDINKPNGITLLTTDNIKNILWPMDVGQMFFVGKKTTEKLKEINIKTIGDLAQYKDFDKLHHALNKNWLQYYHNANGLGDDQLDYSKNIPKSLSISKTFLSPTNNEFEIISELKHQAIELFEKLQYYNMQPRTFGIHFKDINRRSISRNLTLNYYIDTYEILVDNLIKLFERIYSQELWRQIGINVSNFLPLSGKEYNLFSLVTKSKKQDNTLNEIINNINESFKQDVIFIAKEKLQ